MEPALLDRWLQRLETAPFARRVYTNWVGPPPIDLSLDATDVECALEFGMNDPALFRAIEAITRRSGIGSFAANVHRLTAGTDHGDQWHSDVDDNRLVGLSLNMSARAYAGGSLQIADAGSRAVIADIENPTAGNAILFEISPALVHRVGALTAGARTVFAGWFVREPRQDEWRRGLLARLSQSDAADPPPR